MSDGDGPDVDSFDRTLDAEGAPKSERVVVRRNTPVSVPAQRYERVSVHAEGGLGRIWRAQDQLLEREVALKDLRPDAEGEGARRRLVDEAKISGRLEHPGIVPVYDLAVGGAPYYTMRFVAGRTLAEAARTYRAGAADPVELRRLLNAVVTVCNTIEYAHARGVIHRDLKGSNILVGEYGEVIVLDWGLAKRRDDDAADEPDALLGTPSYMAPEQARRAGEAVDEITDVHGLGAVLYEVLTGRPPFEGKTLDEVLARVVDPDRTPPRVHAPETARALDAICLRALASDRARRYRSARALGEDIQRFLADEPVTAYRAGAIERLGRFARRHKTATITAAVLAVATTVGLTVGTVLLQRANAQTEAQRDSAQRNFAEARDAVDTYLTTVSEEHLLDAPGLQPLREHLLSSALAYYKRFVDEHGGDAAATLELAGAERRLGETEGMLGHVTEAIHDLDDALAVYGRLPSNSFEARRGMAETQRAIAELAPTIRALAAGQEAANAFEPLIREHPDDPTLMTQLGRSFDALAGAQYHAGRFADVEATEGKAVHILEEANARFPGDAEIERLLGLVYIDDSIAKDHIGKPAEAIPLIEKAVELTRTLAAQRPEDQLARREFGRAGCQLEKLLLRSGRVSKGMTSGRESLIALRELAAENPSIDSYARQFEVCVGFRAEGLITVGRVSEAAPLIEEAETIGDRRVATSKDINEARDTTAWWHVLGARAARTSGDDARAAKELAAANGFLDAALTAQPSNDDWLHDRVFAHQEQIDLARASGGDDAAAMKAQRALVAEARQLVSLAPTNPSYRGALCETLVRLAELPGDDAAAAASEALELATKLVADDPDDLLARSRYGRGLLARARQALRRGDRAAADADVASARTTLASAAASDPAYLPQLACVETVAIGVARDRDAQLQAAVAVAKRAQQAGVEDLARDACLAPIADRLR
jgi:serine/threonine-protein kinase